MLRLPSLIAFLILLSPMPLRAQWQATPLWHSAAAPVFPMGVTNSASPLAFAEPRFFSNSAPFPYVRAVAYGTGLGAAGWAFAVLFLTLTDDESFTYPILGGMAAHSVLIPTGVWVADKGQGSYGSAVLTSLGIGVAGAAAALYIHPRAIFVTPAAQMVSSLVVEHRTRP